LSYRVYRVDDVVSGRMTPTLPVAFSGVDEVDGTFALLVGGLVSLQAAVIVPLLPPLELGALVLLPFDDEPQALTVSAAATPHVTNPTALLRMAHAFPDCLSAAHRRPMANVLGGNVCHSAGYHS
jgi:hypothetical protein